MQDQLSNTITQYLQKNFSPTLYALDFVKVDQGNLIQELLKTNTLEALKLQELSIKMIIMRYFKESLQRVEVEIKDDQFLIKKSFEYPKESEKFDRHMHDIKIHLMRLEKDKEHYKQLAFLLIFPTDERDALFQNFHSLNVNIYQQRDYIRKFIYDVFDLSQRDIILFLRSKLYIRVFKPPINSSKDRGVERRYEGRSADDLALIFNENFPDGLWGEIEESLPEVLKDQLNFQHINNEQFSKNFVSVFMSMVEILLLEYIEDEQKDCIQGLTGYVLRIYFDKILIYCAENLLKHVLLRDKNAEKFIKYYDGSVSLNAEGKHVKHHMLIDHHRQEWRFNSILSIVIQRQQAVGRDKAQREIIKESLSRLDEHEEIIYKADQARSHQESIFTREKSIFDSLKKDKERINSEIKALNEDSSLIKKMTDAQLRDKVSNLNAELRRVYNKLAISEDIFRKEEESYLNLNTQYKNKQIEYKNRQKHYENDKEILEQIKAKNRPIFEGYENVLNAITKVLAKR